MISRDQTVQELVASGVVHWAESWLYSDGEISRLWAAQRAGRGLIMSSYADGYQDALSDVLVKWEAEGAEAALQYVNDNLNGA